MGLSCVNEHQFPELRQLAGMWFGASPIFEASTEDKRKRYFGENLDMIAFLHGYKDVSIAAYSVRLFLPNIIELDLGACNYP